ncbi:MAG: PKD domain-containing protein, partial [Nanoarchaeota archaeon]
GYIYLDQVANTCSLSRYWNNPGNGDHFYAIDKDYCRGEDAIGTTSWSKKINLNIGPLGDRTHPLTKISVKSIDTSGVESNERFTSVFYNIPPSGDLLSGGLFIDGYDYNSKYSFANVGQPLVMATAACVFSIEGYNDHFIESVNMILRNNHCGGGYTAVRYLEDSDSPDNQHLEARWDFDGDGNWDTPFEKSFNEVYTGRKDAIGGKYYSSKSYTYKTPGYKNVILQVRDPEGEISSWTKKIYVYDKCSDSCNPFDNKQVCDVNTGNYASCPSNAPICFKGKCVGINKNDILTLPYTVGWNHDIKNQDNIIKKCKTTGLDLDPSLPECPAGTRTIYGSIIGTATFRDISNRADTLTPLYYCSIYTLCKNDPDYSEVKYKDIEFKEGGYGPFITDQSSTTSPDPGCDPGFSLLRPLTFDYMNYTRYIGGVSDDKQEEYAKKIVNLCVKEASAYGNYITDIKIQNSGGPVLSYDCSNPSANLNPLKDCSIFGDEYRNVGDFSTESQDIYYKTRCSQTRVCAKRLCEDECSQNKCSNDK